MELLRVAGLPDAPLAAAAQFHEAVVPAVPHGRDLLLVFAPADHRHRGWRLAAVQELARAAVPYRVNAVASDSPHALASARAYLAAAPGLTGQYLPLDDAGAGPVLSIGG